MARPNLIADIRGNGRYIGSSLAGVLAARSQGASEIVLRATCLTLNEKPELFLGEIPISLQERLLKEDYMTVSDPGWDRNPLRLTPLLETPGIARWWFDLPKIGWSDSFTGALDLLEKKYPRVEFGLCVPAGAPPLPYPRLGPDPSYERILLENYRWRLLRPWLSAKRFVALEHWQRGCGYKLMYPV